MGKVEAQPHSVWTGPEIDLGAAMIAPLEPPCRGWIGAVQRQRAAQQNMRGSIDLPISVEPKARRAGLFFGIEHGRAGCEPR
jgi:hypothetical protein